jgi:hypothetical protein
MITQALYNKLHNLATLRRITNDEAKELQAAVQLYINPAYSVCLRCSQQLKHGQKIILNYLSNVEILENLTGTAKEITLLEEEQITPPVVDIVEAEKVGCSKCGRKAKQNKS